MSRRPIPVVGDSYADDPHGFSAQETINWRPVRAQRGGTRSEWKLETPPGLYAIGTVGEGPSRGAHDFEGRHFRVSRRTLQEVKVDGSVWDRGTIPGTGRVSIDHNANGQLVIATGTSGYVYDLTDEALTQITDDGFPGALQVAFQGQYILAVSPDRRFWFHSALNDATSYNTNDRYVPEAAPDRIMGLVALHSQVLVLSERTGEVYVNEPVLNEGVVTASFQRASGIVIERGLGGTHTLVKIGGVAYWVGDDGRGYRWMGNQPEPVTTDLVEKAWAGLNLRTAFSMVYEDAGASIWYVTFTDGQTWAYDIGQGLWHRRRSAGIERWRVADLVKWNRKWYAGDYANANLYLVDRGFVGEGDDPLVSERITGVAHADGERVFWDELELVFADDAESVTPDHVDSWEAIIVSPPVPNFGYGDVVSWQYEQEGGVGDIVWSFTGALPDGLALDDETGLLSGTITSNPPWDWTVIATDSLDHSGSLVENIPLAALEITGSLPDTLDTATYSERLGIVGGVAPYTNPLVVSGDTPASIALSIDGDELVVEWPSGATPDTYAFVLSVDDTEGTTATTAQEVEITETYTIYVGHGTGTTSISVIDPDTATVTNELGTSRLSYPQANTAGTKLYGMGSQYPSEIIIATEAMTAFSNAGGSLDYVMIDGTHLYAMGFSPSRLVKVLIADGSLVDEWTPTASCAGIMAWNADKTKLHMARYGGGGFSVLTVSSGVLSNLGASVTLGRGVAVRSSDDDVFVAGSWFSTPRLMHYSSSGTSLGYCAAAETIHNPQVNPSGTEVWVPNYDVAAGKVYVFDVTDDTPVLTQTITVGNRPNYVAFTPDGLTAIVTNGTGDSVSFVDTTTYTVTDTITVDDGPAGAIVLAN